MSLFIQNSHHNVLFIGVSIITHIVWDGTVMMNIPVVLLSFSVRYLLKVSIAWHRVWIDCPTSLFYKFLLKIEFNRFFITIFIEQRSYCFFLFIEHTIYIIDPFISFWLSIGQNLMCLELPFVLTHYIYLLQLKY